MIIASSYFSIVGYKTDPRRKTSRTATNSMIVDSKGGGGAHASPGGHISRLMGNTINANVRVRKELPLYSFASSNSTPKMNTPDIQPYHIIENPEWDHNFPARRILSPDR